MEGGRNLLSRSRDEPSYDLSNAVYGSLPSCATGTVIQRLRASSPTWRRSSKHLSALALRRETAWLVKKPLDQRIEIQESTCLNLNTAASDNTESDLWILPDFDDWELQLELVSHAPRREREWGPLLRRAVKSNLKGLRTKLEGDGRALVGGKYEEERNGSVDEEFDIVVLPARVPC